jgi:hypothetical protein
MTLKQALIAICVASGTFLPVGSEEAVDEGTASFRPWSGYWWPFSAGGLSEPLAKYDRLTGQQAVDWEEEQGRTDPKAPPWFGYCHGQAAAGIMEREPQTPGKISTSDESLYITIGDQKGWLVACHTHDLVEIHGERFGHAGSESNPDDLRPEHLWHILQLYIRERGVPVVLDVEPGVEVWNYPVFQYTVRYRPTDTPGVFRATLTLWMSDISVPPDYVGVRVCKHTYTFSFRMQGNAVVMGSGRWTGLSRQDHPDFAWYPYAAVAENPHVHYDAVQRLFAQLQPGEPEFSPPPREEPTAPEVAPRPTTEIRWRPPLPPASSFQQSSEGLIPAVTQPGMLLDQILLSPQELVSILVSETSCFKFDVSVDRFDGARYSPGENYRVLGSSVHPGYLYLFLIDPSGELTLLYPMLGQDNRIEGQIEIPKRDDRFAFRLPDKVGLYRIRALVTTKPIGIVGLPPRTVEKPSKASPGAESDCAAAEIVKGEPLRWHPAFRKTVRTLFEGHHPPRKLTSEALADIDPKKVLGSFAQDEIAFYVEAPQDKP